MHYDHKELQNNLITDNFIKACFQSCMPWQSKPNQFLEPISVVLHNNALEIHMEHSYFTDYKLL